MKKFALYLLFVPLSILIILITIGAATQDPSPPPYTNFGYAGQTNVSLHRIDHLVPWGSFDRLAWDSNVPAFVDDCVGFAMLSFTGSLDTNKMYVLYYSYNTNLQWHVAARFVNAERAMHPFPLIGDSFGIPKQVYFRVTEYTYTNMVPPLVLGGGEIEVEE